MRAERLSFGVRRLVLIPAAPPHPGPLPLRREREVVGLVVRDEEVGAWLGEGGLGGVGPVLELGV